MTETDTLQHGTQHAHRTARCRCDECRAWYAAYMRERRTDPEIAARNRAFTVARNRALAKLAQAHPEEYRALYADETARIYEPRTAA